MRLPKVPRFRRFPVFGSFLREYKRYWPELNFRIIESSLLVPSKLDARPENYAAAVVTLRTANDSITRVTPLMIMLTPTRTPIAQAELDGHCM